MQNTLNGLIKIINSNQDLITHGYRGKDDLTCISRELMEKINLFLEDNKKSDIDKREVIKKAIRKTLKLHESDIVFLKDELGFIKFFDTSKIRIIDESEKDTAAARYNGLNEEELKSFYNNFCSIKESDGFYYKIARKFVDDYLLDKKIDNHAYEKQVFQLIQSIINDHLINTFDRNDIFFKGFSGYIFRMHFQDVFGYIAGFILFEISISNKHIISFLNYYSLDVIVMDGKRYKVPEIKAESGLKWNVVSMMSIVKVYNKALISKDSIQIKKDALKKEIAEFYVEDISPIEYNNEINKNIEKVSDEFLYCSRKQDSFMDALNITKDEKEREKIKENIKTIKDELRALTEKKKSLTQKLLSQSNLLKYNNIKKEIDLLNRQQKRDEKILLQNEDAYLSIKNSLIKALISKKIVIKST